MEIAFNIALVFGAVFVVGMLIYFSIVYKFHSLLKSSDPELYEQIRMRLNSFFNKPFMDFIFKKQYQKHSDLNIIKYGHRLYWTAQIAQWGFNIYMLILISLIIIRYTIL